MSDGKYAFEKSKIIQGDCLEKMKLIPDNSVDAIITDIPYGTTACKWDSVIDFDLMWEHLNRVIKNNGAIVLFGAEPFASTLRLSNIKNYKYDWFWEKNLPSGVALAKYQPMRVIENIMVFCDGKTLYNKQMVDTVISDRKIVDGRKNGSGSNGSNHIPMKQVKNVQKTKVNPRNLLKIKCVSNAGGHKLHSTQKPVELIEYLINTYTNEGDAVLDFTAGSGTTGEACINLNRDFILIEKEPKYYEVIKERVGKIFKNYGLDLQPLLDERM